MGAAGCRPRRPAAPPGLWIVSETTPSGVVETCRCRPLIPRGSGGESFAPDQGIRNERGIPSQSARSRPQGFASRPPLATGPGAAIQTNSEDWSESPPFWNRCEVRRFRPEPKAGPTGRACREQQIRITPRRGGGGGANRRPPAAGACPSKTARCSRARGSRPRSTSLRSRTHPWRSGSHHCL